MNFKVNFFESLLPLQKPPKHVCYETLLLESRGIAGRRFFSLAQFFILCLPILWWNKMAAHQNDIKTSSKISDQSQAI